MVGQMMQQASVTFVLCNRIIRTIGQIKETVLDLHDLECHERPLVQISTVLSWCSDIERDVLEIKSQI